MSEPIVKYATLEEIRMKAGFEKATNLDDKYVRAARRAAQSEINDVLSNRYTVPFTPVPEKIRSLTIKLAAYSLKYDAFHDISSEKALEALRKQLVMIASGETPITDNTGVSLSTDEGVDGYFGTADRMFSVDQRF